MCVGDDEGDLGRLSVTDVEESLVATHRDDLVAEHHHEGDAVVVVDRREILHVARRHRGVRTEVAQVPGPLGEFAVEFDELVRVLGNDGSQRHRAAVGGENIDYPRMGIGVSGVGLRRLVARAAGIGIGLFSHGDPPGRVRVAGTKRGVWR